MMPQFAKALLLVAGLAACSAAPAADGLAGRDGAAAPATRAEKVALALQAAASAEAAGDAAGIARALQVVEASGAKPLPDATEDPVAAWRATAGELAPPMRGRPLGPGYRSGRVAPGGRDTFAQLFLSGTASVIAISAPTGDRVSLRVRDQKDQPVCQREAAQSGACRWVPLFTQRYTIEVTNPGEEDARYFLVIE